MQADTQLRESELQRELQRRLMETEALLDLEKRARQHTDQQGQIQTEQVVSVGVDVYMNVEV